MKPRFLTAGPYAAANATFVRTASAIGGAGAVVLNGTTVLDTPRRVIFTSAGNDSGISFVVSGTAQIGSSIVVATETVVGANAGVASTNLDWKTISGITSSGASAGNVSIGTNTIGASGWLKLNGWDLGSVLMALVVSGTVNYTVQVSLDDPDETPAGMGLGGPFGGVPATGAPNITVANMAWFSSNDTNVVGATTNQMSNLWFLPIWVRILVNSSTSPGFVRGTFLQAGGDNS